MPPVDPLHSRNFLSPGWLIVNVTFRSPTKGKGGRSISRKRVNKSNSGELADLVTPARVGRPKKSAATLKAEITPLRLEQTPGQLSPPKSVTRTPLRQTTSIHPFNCELIPKSF